MKGYRSRGIVLKSRDFGEAARLVTLFSPGYGKIRAIAYGARRVNSRKAGSLLSFSLIEFYCLKGRTIDIISEVELVKRYDILMQDLKLARQAYFVCELVDRLTAENEEQEQLFDLLRLALDKIARQDFLIVDLVSFESKMLRLLGFGVPDRVGTTEEEIKKHALIVGYIEEIIGRGLGVSWN